MPNINCDAVKCVFNTHGGCSRNFIEVEGKCATDKCCETHCDSFSDKIQEVKNCACTDGCPCDCAEIECNVKECMYNQNDSCAAQQIKIGTANAKCNCETECDTFKKKQ